MVGDDSVNLLTDSKGSAGKDEVIMDEGTQSSHRGQLEDVDEPSDGWSANQELPVFPLIRNIAMYLDSPHDLIGFMCVSKSVFRAVASVMWENPQFGTDTPSRELKVSKFLRSLASPRAPFLFPHIRKIDFHQVELTDDEVDAVAFACTTLYSFGVHSPNISLRSIVQLLRKHTNIRSLDISGCVMVETDMLLRICFAGHSMRSSHWPLPGLELVELSLANTITQDSDVPTLLNVFPKLKSLDLGTTYITDKTLLLLSETNLERLSLSGCSSLTAYAIENFVQSAHIMAKLKHLDISSTAATLKTLQHVLESGTCLKSFHIGDCSATASESVPAGAPLLPIDHALTLQLSLMMEPETTTPSGVIVSRIGFEALSLGDVEDNLLRFIIARCPFLKELKLTGDKVDDSLMSLVANLEHLKVFEISNSKVTQFGIRTLIRRNAPKGLKQLRTPKLIFGNTFIGEMASLFPKLEYWETANGKYSVAELTSLTFDYFDRAVLEEPVPVVWRSPLLDFGVSSISLPQVDPYSYPQHSQLSDPSVQPTPVFQPFVFSSSYTDVPLPHQPLPSDGPADDSRLHALEAMLRNFAETSASHTSSELLANIRATLVSQLQNNEAP